MKDIEKQNRSICFVWVMDFPLKMQPVKMSHACIQYVENCDPAKYFCQYLSIYLT